MPEYKENRTKGEYCKYMRQEEEGKAANNENRSFIFCTLCNVALCLNLKRNCFVEYHSSDS